MVITHVHMVTNDVHTYIHGLPMVANDDHTCIHMVANDDHTYIYGLPMVANIHHT